MNLKSYLLISFASLVAPNLTHGITDEAPKLRGSRLLTLAQDFAKSQPFDYNAILRQEEIENEESGGKEKGHKVKDIREHGAWRTAQCVASGEACYIGDSCCSGGKCPACNIGPCTCE